MLFKAKQGRTYTSSQGILIFSTWPLEQPCGKGMRVPDAQHAARQVEQNQQLTLAHRNADGCQDLPALNTSASQGPQPPFLRLSSAKTEVRNLFFYSLPKVK